MSQEHGIGLGETSGTVDFLGCFLWTSAQGRVPFVCESIGGEDAQSPLLKEEIGPEASRECQNLVAGAGQEYPRLGATVPAGPSRPARRPQVVGDASAPSGIGSHSFPTLANSVTLDEALLWPQHDSFPA